MDRIGSLAVCFTSRRSPPSGLTFAGLGHRQPLADGDPRAGYVLIEAAEVGFSVEFVRVEYDLGKAMEGIRNSELPDEFAEQLAAGGTPKTVEVS